MSSPNVAVPREGGCDFPRADAGEAGGGGFVRTARGADQRCQPAEAARGVIA
jgi:hypothetical protein